MRFFAKDCTIYLNMLIVFPMLFVNSVAGNAFPARLEQGQPTLQTLLPTRQVFLPVVMDGYAQNTVPRVNMPFFQEDVPFNEMAIFWFGKVTFDQNYTDVRIGYNSEAIYIHAATTDRRLWCNQNPEGQYQNLWDSVSIYLNTGEYSSNGIGASSFRFSDQLASPDCPSKPIADWGSTGKWLARQVPFNTSTTWRGDALNNNTDDRGWTIDYRIPFSSLGLSTTPNQGSVWRLAVKVYNRNDASGSTISVGSWPTEMENTQPDTWGELVFGYPIFITPSANDKKAIIIQNKLDGVSVGDGWAGGGTDCGDGMDFWTQWGETSHPGSETNDRFNIQNQGDIADWPCYSKYYITFPLSSIPVGKVILSADLVLHQFGNSGGGGWGQPPRSLIQVFTVGGDFSESSLTWNNAPQAMENVSQSWVDPLSSFPGWPGVPRTWDVSRAASWAYTTGQPLRLALYSADEGYHTGKYFSSSDTGDWNAAARPELQIVFGNP